MSIHVKRLTDYKLATSLPATGTHMPYVITVLPATRQR